MNAEMNNMEKTKPTTLYYVWDHWNPENADIYYNLQDMIDTKFGEEEEVTVDTFDPSDYDMYVEECEVGDNRYFVVSNNDESGYIIPIEISNDWSEIVKNVKNQLREDILAARESDDEYDWVIEDDSLLDGIMYLYTDSDRNPEVFDKNVPIEEAVDILWEEFKKQFTESYVDKDSSSQYHIYDVVEDDFVL